MKFDGAIIKEQGVTFAIAIVKKDVLNNSFEVERTRNGFSRFFPGVPVILMAQDSYGTPTYHGRKDIVQFLSRISPSRIPWKTYTSN